MRKWVPLVASMVVAALPLPNAFAQVPQGDPTDLPVLSEETRRGTGTAVDVVGPSPVAKVVDGSIADWVGEPSRYGGTLVYSGGELVYQDHLFDAHGADDGRDAARFERTDPAEEVIPGLYRLDALSQADAPGELGIEMPDQYRYDDTYGDAVDHQDSADLEEVRVAISGDDLALLARTTTMAGAKDTALVLLADTLPGDTARTVPFNSGLTSNVADVAVFVADGTVRVADLATGEIYSPAGSAVSSPTGFTNALEASVPLSALAAPDGSLSLALASGKPNGELTGFANLALELPGEATYPNVANVAFRLDEPVRMWFEKNQALALNAHTIDRFFLSVDTAALGSGASQEYMPGPGYHDRIFTSDLGTGVPREGGQNGVFQHYGVYVPSSYDGSETPLQWWLHWRGGTAHSGASVVPKVMTQLGEDRDTIVVAPSGRGTSTWYVGRGHVDFLEVWADLFDTFAIDRDRVYVSGHSMGGWGTYLLTLLYPDRFAAGAPVAGPVTQGAWTGLDFGEQCDEFAFEEYTPCYISANGSRPRDQHTRKLLENARHVPYAILHGTDDELVPYPGVARQAQRLVELGYRHRFYTYPGYEHYSHPVADQWAEMGSYLHSFTRPANPAHVTYQRSMPFELATEEVQSDGAKLDFDFDSAYWMSELTPREARGNAFFDGRSLAIEEQPYVVAPDTTPPTAPGQTGPYVVEGLQWIDDPTKEPAPTTNGFHVTVSGTKAVRLDLGRMKVAASEPIAATVWTNDGALDLRLDGGWIAVPEVTIDDEPVQVTLDSGVLDVPVPQGEHTLGITPGQGGAVATSLAFTPGSDRSAQYSDSATLEARLAEASRAPIAGRALSFSLGSSSATAQTDGDGVARVTLPIADAPGDYAATVSFAGADGALDPALATEAVSITRDDSATAMVSGGGKSPLIAELTDADSASGLAGRTIVFFADGDRVGAATTNADGVASMESPKNKRGKGVVFEAVFEGDTFYARSSDTR
ncbi:MAG TPA: prolyl oligopeptidase family serine peptidase [Actinomycetota bacterium]|jgi:poly(3-hydroxybutyrate) depolymerase